MDDEGGIVELATVARSVTRHCLAAVERVSRRDRPGWVDPGWWSMPVRSDLLRVLRLRPGPDLVVGPTQRGENLCPGEHEREPVLVAAG